MNELKPMVVQDADTKQVLSLVYCNDESLKRSREKGFLYRYSRQYGKVMKKGETSGNVQELVSLASDCDSDAVLATVRQRGGGACHTGGWTCFSEEKGVEWGSLDELIETIRLRKKEKPSGSYVASIVCDADAVGEKLREEANELAEAIREKSVEDVAWEAADVLFFTLVALENRGVGVGEVLAQLESRRGKRRQ